MTENNLNPFDTANIGKAASKTEGEEGNAIAGGATSVDQYRKDSDVIGSTVGKAAVQQDQLIPSDPNLDPNHGGLGNQTAIDQFSTFNGEAVHKKTANTTGMDGDSNAKVQQESHILGTQSIVSGINRDELMRTRDAPVVDHITQDEAGNITHHKVASNWNDPELDRLHNRVINLMAGRPEGEIRLDEPYWAANNEYRQALKAANRIT